MAALDLMQLDGDQAPTSKLLKQGAEARVFESSFMGRKAVVKERFSKKYRHPVLDAKLTSKRLLGEARLLAKARRLGVVTPALYAVDPVTASLTFEYVPGASVKDLLLQSGPLPSPGGKIEEIAKQIGKAVAKLHDGGVVHGDLTTSNMLIRPDTNQLVMIDFGLSFTSALPEDKAVDLYVLERALISLHSSNGDIMGLVMSSYKQSSKLWSSTLNKLAAVRMRGRKRVMIG
ncbi:TP53 regulating kinase and related kinases [Marchantia polymorpha subsp. ruderalis]|uniref:non-specific serine/threonine protein kinase n=4 Tax=Marchantia polymorpha TaxID=3197 RepID=A0AAF6BEH7_MARPO|nr:hypothetical protein MARPO_0133s0052 [Marchantia polymorpha]BBN10411.1 hypothetical protein Mp_5g03350 [Marchantia polymorpha subsp. ruderalis]|eukprot:PTQ29912.1 hypothetical protein MARPO_0133s0052 [Marchantia polymorpha]